ncbi:MAG: hypothetical protein ACOCWI_04055, partial [Bacillota bacterium]
MGEKVYKNLKKNKKKVISWFMVIAFVLFIIIYYNVVTIPYVKTLAEESVAIKAIDTINETNDRIQRLRAFYGEL